MTTRDLPVSTALSRMVSLWDESDRREAPMSPAPASAVVPVRDTGSGLECFLTRQTDAPGVADRNRWGFPTSRLRTDDSELGPVSGWAAGKCAKILQIEDSHLAMRYFVAAARTLLLSCGVILAEDSDGRLLGEHDFSRWDEARGIVARGESSFPGMLQSRDLKFRSDMLRPWLRWINAPEQFRRSDTVYCITTVPLGQQIRFASPNMSWGGWMRPRDVLEQSGTDAELLPAAVRIVLEELAAAPTVGTAMSRVNNLEPVTPRLVKRGDEWRLLVERPPADRIRTARHYGVVEPQSAGSAAGEGHSLVSNSDNDQEDN